MTLPYRLEASGCEVSFTGGAQQRARLSRKPAAPGAWFRLSGFMVANRALGWLRWRRGSPDTAPPPRYYDIRAELLGTPTQKIPKAEQRKDGITPTTWDRGRTRRVRAQGDAVTSAFPRVRPTGAEGRSKNFDGQLPGVPHAAPR
jgi:hypothetical protein